jgi:hypothetical protein
MFERLVDTRTPGSLRGQDKKRHLADGEPAWSMGQPRPQGDRVRERASEIDAILFFGHT